MIFGLGRKKEILITAPVAGTVKPISSLSDETFSTDMLGRGIAVEPTKGRIVAPADGTVSQMFETGHALSMVTDSGAELLIHIGIDTVKLKGKHFTKKKSTGDAVKAGDVLIEFDAGAIASEGYETVIVIVVLNPGEFGDVRFESGTVQEGDPLIRLEQSRR
jgi:PTS system, glucose subfamily, IIA component